MRMAMNINNEWVVPVKTDYESRERELINSVNKDWIGSAVIEK